MSPSPVSSATVMCSWRPPAPGCVTHFSPSTDYNLPPRNTCIPHSSQNETADTHTRHVTLQSQATGNANGTLQGLSVLLYPPSNHEKGSLRILTYGVIYSLMFLIGFFSPLCFVVEDELSHSVVLCFPCGVLPAQSFCQSGI